jgi:AraC-like DNA-binding protein
MLDTMTSSVVPLRRQPLSSPEPVDALRGVRSLVESYITSDGYKPTPIPDVCTYRFSSPQCIGKGATFGVALGVVLQGTKLLRIEGKELTVEAPSLIVITREAAHDNFAICASPERPYLGLFVCFTPERVANALLSLAEAGGPSSEDDAAPVFVIRCDEGIAGALERLLGAMRDPIDAKLFAPLAREELLLRLLRSDAAAALRASVANKNDASRILESMQFIRERHAHKLTVEEIARRVAMSPSHFAHRFSAVARMSPMRYVREVRLMRARALLLERDARAGEVAMHVGFESPAHFAREFKRRFGVSPSHYLRVGEG